MSEVRSLLDAYRRHVRLPWEAALAGPQRVWFAIYDPNQERRVRFLLDDFATATTAANHGWRLVDISHEFGRWLVKEDYREGYFAEPQYLDGLLPQFSRHLAGVVAAELGAEGVDEHTVVAIAGVGSLFGLARASALIETVASHIQGRLLVFFPGERTNATYRLLGAGDGWNYLAVPITANEEVG